MTHPPSRIAREIRLRVSLISRELTSPQYTRASCRRFTLCLHFPIGGEIRDTETLNLSRNIVSLQVFVGREVSRYCGCPFRCSFWVGASHRAKPHAPFPLGQKCPRKIAMSMSSSIFSVFHLARSTWPATKTFFAG